MFPLYVRGLPGEITLDDLIIYFQSGKSGGGDIDNDACKLDGDRAVIVFEKKEDLDNVLQKVHEIDGYKLEISAEDKPKKPTPKPRTKKKPESKPNDNKEEFQLPNQPDVEKAHLGEIRTVIVSGLSPDSTNETVKMLFESGRRSNGGEIENLERLDPNVAHVTFASAEVAAGVLKQDKLELDGYLLQLKEKQPELFLPLDRKKLYVENINPDTSKDSLWNYMEVRTKLDVFDIQFGDNRNAFITFNEEPDMKRVSDSEKTLEGAVLKISNPPVCNSVLVTGLSKKTTKQAIEMYFENERNGGGRIYGDILYQKDKGIAVVSFCDPMNVVKTLSGKEHKLDHSVLTLRQHYPFMEKITETTTKMIKVDIRVLDHVVMNCEKELLDRFGANVLQILKGNREEFNFPSDTANEIEDYLAGFAVEKIPIGRKLLDTFRNELKDMITNTNQGNITVETDEDNLKIEIVGGKGEVTHVHGQFQTAMAEMEKQLNIVTKMIHDVAKTKFDLLSFHGAIEILERDFHVEVGFGPRRDTITLKGTGKHVSMATEEMLKKCSQITEDNADLSKNEKHFLENGGLQNVNAGMKEIGLTGMIFLTQIKRNKAKILVFGKAKVEEVESHLRTEMYEKQHSLDEDSRTLLNSNKWKEFHENVTTGTSVMILTDLKPPKISLIGKKSEVEKAYDSMREFMKRNTIVKESIGLNDGYEEYLLLYCKKDFETIENNFKEHYVKMYIGEDDQRLIISGTKEGVKKAKRLVDEIVSTIAKGSVCVDRQRDQKYLKSEEGKACIAVVQSKNECLIRLTENNGSESAILSSTGSMAPPSKPTSKLLCSYETREKISLKVYKDDITAHPCDVIVNAANGELQHIGGVAKSILDVGGKEIQEECDEHVNENGKLFDGECFSGSPGKLPCKVLVHAVGPRWDPDNSEKICRVLSVTCMRALEEAMKYRSVALPAIGSGVFGVPKEVCANIMIEAAEKFSRNHEDSNLKEIHFVNNDDASGQVFVKKFYDRFGGRPSFVSNEESRFRPSPIPRFHTQKPDTQKSARKAVSTQRADLQRRKSDDSIFTKRNMKISVVVGDLATYKADVLVNTTGQTLDLDSNPCSKALSYEAGPALQAECNKVGQLKPGQIAVTSGGNLLCDDVFHVVCVKWSGGQGEEVLRMIMKNCLKRCNSNRKRSIAFPAIGTGVLGFPRDVAAKIFFEETKEFEKRVPNSSIKEVSFVVYSQDAKSIQAFKNEVKRQPEWGSSTSVGNVADGPQKRWKRNPVGAEKSDLCVEIGNGKKVEIVKGDITKERTDVIAHLTNPNLFMRSGVAIALVKAGGKVIEDECQDKADSYTFLNTTTVLTTAGRLDAKHVAHMVASNDPTSNEIEKCITNCLKKVRDNECESISFPAVGTGSLNHVPEKAAKTIFSSIVRFLQSSPGSLKTVRIVLKDDRLVEAFQASVKKFKDDEEPGVLKKFVNYFWNTESPTLKVIENTPVTTVTLLVEIYAKDEATIALAKEKILKVMEKQKKKEKIEDENIEKLSNKQVGEIKRLCDVNDVKITIEKEISRIILNGYSEDISAMLTKIYQVLKRIGEAEKEKEKAEWYAEYAEMISKSVQWFYVDPATGDHEEYHKHTNAIIEKAYCKREKSVTFVLQDGKCKIVFDKMQERNLDTGTKTEVIRKAKEIAVPDYWEPQPLDANGKELAVHLVLLDPKNPTDKKECKEISDHFHKTSGQQIIQIQRIQNPSLYKLYVTKKQSLDKEGGKGSNEGFFFHGTTPDKLNEINEKGLNRSFAGNTNGVAFGKGVYFARDASMSVGYAQPDRSTGLRYMYYTRVAVGEYTNGAQGMLVPPRKGKSGNDSYDSVVNDVNNPTIFVLFYDNQYYPEYLITFQ